MQKHRHSLSPCLLASLSPCLLVLLAACSVPTPEAASPFLPTAQIALAATATLAPSPTRIVAFPTATPALPSPTLPAPSATLLPSAVPTVAPTAVSSDPNTTFERQVYALINQLRAENGVAPLAYNALLADAARAHSCEQAANSAISHTSSDGRTLAQRLPPADPPWEWPSENIAAGFATPAELVRAWFDERPPDDWHRRNILGSDQRELGVGFCANANGAPGYGNVVTADFARRTNLFPLVLNGGAATTDSAAIRYWLYGAGWAETMRLGATPDLGALPWQPFAAEGSYTLSPATGPQTVYAELRGLDGATQIVSATIGLNVSAK